MAEDDLIPSVGFDATLVGRRRCYEAWRETVRPFFYVEPLSDVSEGRESVKAWLVDDLVFTNVAISPQTYSHNAAQAENAGYISLQIYLEGECRGVAADQTFCMRPGQIHLFDFSREYYAAGDRAVVAGVIFPHDAIGYDPARHPGQMKLACTTPAGSLLIDTFMSLLGQLPMLRKDEASGLADGFCDLLRRHLISGPVEEPKVRKLRVERRADMRSYIEQRLDDPDFTVEQLCRAFCASIPTVYRDFAHTGGIARYITMRQLGRSFQELLSAPPGRGRVREVASRYCFDDPGYFSRLFQKRFGISPSAVSSLGYSGKNPAARPYLPAAAIGEANLGDWLKGHL